MVQPRRPDKADSDAERSRPGHRSSGGGDIKKAQQAAGYIFEDEQPDGFMPRLDRGGIGTIATWRLT
jgi:hypothetical protein